MIRHKRSYQTLLNPKTPKHALGRKNLTSLLLLTIITAATLNLAGNFLLPTANATYVEGAITRDTVWTLVDSPFVLSNDVTVYPNASLTIEPGVEVKAGGNFSLIINGQLTASGSQDKTIQFTSNSLLPQSGDWNGIEISSTGTTTLAFCTISYAKTGLNMLNGIVEIRNNLVKNNDVGVSISGGIATVQNNTIKSNGDGFLLSGGLSSISITQNLISSNTQSGIHLDADSYTNVVILYNILSANNKGFYFKGSASTYITNNSVSYNNVGFSYENGPGHVARFNDIYGNDMAMIVLSATTVDATYNYWGDPSGPFHPSLNPAGRGNPVTSTGIDVDFIYWLTAPIGYINQRPVARLLSDVSRVSPGQLVTFFGTTSIDDRRVDLYYFDFGDGQNSGWTSLSVVVHKYSAEGTYSASVKVMDDFGVVSDNMASVTITSQVLPSLTVTLTPSDVILSSGGQVSLTVHVSNASSSMSGANVNLFSILGGNFVSSSGVTDSTGDFATTFSAPNVTMITNVRIVASASYGGYVDGSDFDYLLVQPPLMVSIVVNPSSVKSEATSTVTVSVTYSGAPVNASIVTVSSNSTGYFNKVASVTGANGTCSFVFTAPQSSISLDVNIFATATKADYLDGQGQILLKVEPKVMSVQVLPSSAFVNSEVASNVTVRVVYGTVPIANATVVLSSDGGGSFSPTTAMTDLNGQSIIAFTPPRVLDVTNVTLTATVTKAGYAQSSNHTLVTVNLGALSVQINSNPFVVDSRGTSEVTVHITYNGQPVAGAAVNVSSSVDGAFPVTTGTTNDNGDCVFTFNAPETSVEFSLGISADAGKFGYLDGQAQASIAVTPASSPWLSLPVIIALATVILVIVVVLILVKLKVIVVSQKEGE